MAKQPKHWLPPFATLRTVLAVTAFIAGASFCFASEKTHATPSFYYLNQLPISWIVYGVILVVAAICLLIEKIRPIGYLLGAILYTFFTFAVWTAVIGGFHLHVLYLDHLNFPKGQTPSYFAAGNLTTLAVLYWSALRSSIYAQVDPERSITKM